jgi:glycosyltransferase involved in cell wall biosynthesis
LTGTAITGLAFSGAARAEFSLTLIVLVLGWAGILIFVMAACLGLYLRLQVRLNAVVTRESNRLRVESSAADTRLKAEVNESIADSVRRTISESRRLVTSAQKRVSADLMKIIDEREREVVARFNDELGAALKVLRDEQEKEIAMVNADHHADVEKHNTMVDELRISLDSQLLAQNESNLHRVLKLAQRLGSCEDIFTLDELRIMSEKFHDYDALTIHWLLSSYNAFDILPLSQRRKLATDLRSIGYLAKSLEVFRYVVKLTNKERDRDAFALRQGELKVYSGRYETDLVQNSEFLDRIPGHILHVVGKAMPRTQSGYTLRTHYTAVAQRQTGLQVSVVSQMGETDGDSRGTDTVDDIVYYTLPGQAKNSIPLDDWLTENIEQLLALVKDIRPSLLHAHSDFFNAISAQAVGDYFGIPVVYESRGFWEESWLSRTEQRFNVDWANFEARWGLPEAYALRKAREEEARSRADRVFTLARVMKDRIVEAGIPASKVALVPNSVNSDDFPVLERDLDLAKELEVPDECVTIGYVSSIVEYEGIDTLLEGFKRASQEIDRELRLLIVGDGPVLDALKEQAKKSRIRNVIFTGRVAHKDILSYYSLIDIFVVPRRPAAVCHLVTPLKPFEAFSTGRTVVMSDVQALREIAEDSGAAELFTAGDPDSLAGVLRNLLDNPERRLALANRGAEWVRAQRSWGINAAEYLAVYEDLGATSNG